MATTEQVRQYLAHWFQLGRRVFGKSNIEWCPQTVIQGDRYSAEFEACWSAILEHGGEDCYLESTEQTLAQLLSASWELEPCSRCPLLVPIKVNGIQTGACPCSELSSWPNFEVPMPRLPVDSQARLTHICDRVQQSPGFTGDTERPCKRYPLPQSIALQTAIELQLAKDEGSQDSEHTDEISCEAAPNSLRSLPADPNALGRIRDRVSRGHTHQS